MLSTFWIQQNSWYHRIWHTGSLWQR